MLARVPSVLWLLLGTSGGVVAQVPDADPSDLRPDRRHPSRPAGTPPLERPVAQSRRRPATRSGKPTRRTLTDSLEFLVADLKDKIGTSGRPVVLTHHVDLLRYAQPLPVEDKKAEGLEWDPADVKGFHDAIKGYAVAAIFYGHTHTRNVYRWDGSNKAAKEGIPCSTWTTAATSP